MFPRSHFCCSNLQDNAALATIEPDTFNGLTVTGSLCVCFAASGRCDGYMRDLYLRRSLAGPSSCALDRSMRGAVVLLHGALLLGSLSGAGVGVQRASLLRCGLLSGRG